MKKILFIMLILCNNAFADCNFIKNNDLKYFCKGVSEQSYSCGHIRNNDDKYFCYALSEDNEAYCNFIKNNDLKYFCKGFF